nr:neuroguidin [Ipomoea batatas]
MQDSTGVYRPPKLAPAIMNEDKTSRQERNALRKEQEMLRQAKQSTYMKELIDDIEGRPEEWREAVGTESRELKRYMAKMEKRAQQEEEQFSRAPLTKLEKKKMKHLKKSRNGLLGLTESFYDEIKTLPFEEGVSDHKDLGSSGTVERKQKKRKVIVQK